jgi:hypothetical protein
LVVSEAISERGAKAAATARAVLELGSRSTVYGGRTVGLQRLLVRRGGYAEWKGSRMSQWRATGGESWPCI